MENRLHCPSESESVLLTENRLHCLFESESVLLTENRLHCLFESESVLLTENRIFWLFFRIRKCFCNGKSSSYQQHRSLEHTEVSSRLPCPPRLAETASCDQPAN